MIIRFKNWAKFQPRKDIAHQSWFRLNNNFFFDSKVYELDHAGIITFLYLLCEASRQNKGGETFLSRIHYRIHSRLQDRDLNRALKKLQELQIIEQPTLRGRYVDVTQTCSTDNTDITNKHNITADSVVTERRQVFDFELLYKKYPRKEGKSRGFVICKTQIKSPEDYAALSLAIDRYITHVKREATEARFIKQFSTFMGCWRDWLEADAGSVEKPKRDYSFLGD